MSSRSTAIRISGLGKEKLHLLQAQAKAIGATAEEYATALIEQGILLEQRARTETFDRLYLPVQKRFRNSGITEQQLDKLVDQARARHRRGTIKKKN